MSRKHYQRGDRVKIEGHVGVKDDDGQAASVELHGTRARVANCGNPVYDDAKTGERRVVLELDNGSIVSVPEKALHRTKTRGG